MSCRVLLQNLGDRPIVLDPHTGLAIQFRNGHTALPLPPDAESNTEYVYEYDDAEEGERREVVRRAGCRAPLRLAPLQTGLLTDLSFRAPAPMRFEPDFLEACDTLRATVIRGTEGEEVEVDASFAGEATIWNHYEQITSHVRASPPRHAPARVGWCTLVGTQPARVF
jgi:hypothetical protein